MGAFAHKIPGETIKRTKGKINREIDEDGSIRIPFTPVELVRELGKKPIKQEAGCPR